MTSKDSTGRRLRSGASRATRRSTAWRAWSTTTGSAAAVQSEATRLAGELQSQIAGGFAGTDLIGPAPCFFAKQRNDYRWQIVVRGPDPAALVRRVPIPLGWRVDVDPVDML